MKIFSAAKTLKPAAARNCFLLNQFATPGLGSLIAGRILAGFGQLTLAVAGFVFILVWFGLTMREYYSLVTGNSPAVSYTRYFLAGAALFAVSWLWSLVTSISIMRNAKVPEPPPPGSVPPRLPNPPPKI